MDSILCRVRAALQFRRAAASSSPPWADLPAELLGDIAGRLHTTADYVRFHAICRSWRAVHVEEEDHKPRLPWLLAPSSSTFDDDLQLEEQRCRCVFSKETYRMPGICDVRDRRVACTSSAAAWLVTGGGQHNKGVVVRLVNPLTGKQEQVPDEGIISTEWLGRRHRIISGAGAVVLVYELDDLNPAPDYDEYPRRRRFRVSFLRPGCKRWLSVSSYLRFTDRCCAVACYRDSFVVCVGLVYCHVLKPYGAPTSGVHGTREVRVALPGQPAGKVRRSSYLVECDGGDLLLARVLQDTTSSCIGGGLSVSLHELRLENNGGQDHELAVEWVRRDDADMMIWLRDHVLFLGFPASFAAKAAPYNGEVSGGTTYFVIESGGQGRRRPLSVAKTCSVYKYSFHNNEATLVETLPSGWHDARCLWFLPRPQIQTLFEHQKEGSGEPAGNFAGESDGARQQMQLRIYAGDLSPKVDNARLREMFSVYGKVATARVAYDKRGRSRGFGFVTMATQEGYDKAMAALNPVVKEEPDDISFDFIDLCLGLLALFLILVVLFYIFKGCKILFLALFS
ncbi:hypothetical protein HU200_010841 [Digitaria exilis]|uniref:RRM domain-containing protein n=1 Tax=Digitaria exilis TaxID=1010633 RepID=A0A835FIG9_9POAL|nr:hypothetical protein HU200_010841 [Digitaria exilis]